MPFKLHVHELVLESDRIVNNYGYGFWSFAARYAVMKAATHADFKLLSHQNAILQLEHVQIGKICEYECECVFMSFAFV